MVKIDNGVKSKSIKLQKLLSQPPTFKAQEIIQIVTSKCQLLSHLQLGKTFKNITADTLKIRRQINVDNLLIQVICKV